MRIPGKKCGRVVVLVLFLASLVFSGGYLSADRCEDALFKCLDDPLIHLMLGGPLFCAHGYIFCLKYLSL